MSRCTGVILAGGEASRYGGAPKGLERVGGRRIIDRVVDALSAVTDSLMLVANDAAADGWLPGVRRVEDVHRGAGGLGGIHAALSHAGSAVLVVAWDMPFVPAELLAELRREGETPGADAAVPESDSRRGLEPLCAYYGPRCLAAVESRLARGERKVIAFFEDITVRRIPATTVARFGDPSIIFMNINTPAELALAEEHVASTHGGDHRRQA